jgi:hypothetical protein
MSFIPGCHSIFTFSSTIFNPPTIRILIIIPVFEKLLAKSSGGLASVSVAYEKAASTIIFPVFK